MKNITFILLFISFNTFAQVNLPVYYTIPPTVAGCDGIVAIDTRNLIFGNCPSPYIYTTDCTPNIFGNINWVTDTIYITGVCTLPCSFIISSALGVCATCQVLLPTGIEGSEDASFINYDSKNELIELKNIPYGEYEFNLWDISGRLIERREVDVESDSHAEQISLKNEGVYFYSLKGNQKFISGRIVK